MVSSKRCCERFSSHASRLRYTLCLLSESPKDGHGGLTRGGFLQDARVVRIELRQDDNLHTLYFMMTMTRISTR